jgi:sugar lactone lactonase YvrE
MRWNVRAAGLIMAVFAAAPLTAQATMAPVNDLPNPYRTIEGWAKLPDGRIPWGSTSAVAIDRDGQSIWIAERCGANSCVGSSMDPVMKFDANGNLLQHFGAGMLVFPHGILVDRDGSVWVVDGAPPGGGRRGGAPPAADAPRPPAPTAGHQVFKFSPDGRLLLTLGKAGGAREPEFFFQPNAIAIAPNGDIFVSEGHSSAAGSLARILKFSKDGKLIKTWGQFGDGPDDFNQPHALAFDSKGRLFVGDRSNNRIKIFDQDGRLLDTWYQFSRPSGVFIDRDDNLYVADSESQSVGNGRDRQWKRGIRIGSAKDGTVKYFIPDPVEKANNTSSAEGIAVDAKGNIWGAEVGPTVYDNPVRSLIKKYVRN